MPRKSIGVGHGTFTPPWESSVVSPVFSDSFSSGDLSHAENGYSWGTSRGAVVTNERARTGTYSLRVTHEANPDCSDSFNYQDFAFGGANLPEVWTEIYIWIPTNYHHRDQGAPCGNSDNNKFFELWADERSTGDKLSMIIEVNENEPDSTFRPTRDNNFDIARTISGSLISDFITDTERGQWNRLRTHVKVGTYDNNDGVVQISWNGVTALNRTDLDYYKDPNGGLGSANYIDNGRIQGWSNSGYDEETSFFFDDFSIYDSDPGWVF